jgi:hypothetical protein
MFTQRDVFDGFMRSVWGDDPDAPDMDTFSDAFDVANVMGAKRTNTVMVKGETYHEYLFPDGSVIWIGERNGRGSEVTHDPHNISGMDPVVPQRADA